MLLALEISNFGLIDHLELDLLPGLNVITGETGAGKSMLIDAVELVVGGRASADQIRTGQERARVDAAFDVSDQKAASECLAAAGLDAAGDQVVLSREVNSSGRHLCRVNGRLATVGVVREVAGHLVDIHGQHEHQSLLRPARHREVLDAYGGPELLALAARMRDGYRALRSLEQELASLAGDARDRARREDLLRFQLVEIEGLALRSGEDEELRRERHLLANAERLAAAADAVYAHLCAGGTPGTPARDLLGLALAELETAAALDQRLEASAQSLRAMVYELDDLAREMRRYRESVEFDPGRLELVQGRLEQIALLRRKYADTVEGVLQYAAGLREQLERLAGSEEAAARLEGEIAAARGALAEVAAALSAARHAASSRLAQEVAGELVALGMPDAVFEAPCERRPDPAGLEVAGQTTAFGPHGVDEIEFLLSPNPGEPPRRLDRSASGGELSRIMLALKTVLARADRIPCLIFDEIDSGVGGNTAHAVGLRLARLGRTHQVLCVTHLPQIAAFATRHFVAQKTTDGQRTASSVRAVDGEERLGELARMLGAVAGSAAAHEHARELLRLQKTLAEQ